MEFVVDNSMSRCVAWKCTSDTGLSLNSLTCFPLLHSAFGLVKRNYFAEFDFERNRRMKTVLSLATNPTM